MNHSGTIISGMVPDQVVDLNRIDCKIYIYTLIEGSWQDTAKTFNTQSAKNLLRIANQLTVYYFRF